MNGRESKITRIVLSDDDFRKTILDRIRKSESIVGIKVFANNRNYIITNGSLDKVSSSIKELKSRIEHEYRFK